MNQEELQITVTLTVEQTNALLAALNDLPHRVSRQLIDIIYAQGAEQVARANATAVSNDAVDEQGPAE